MSYGLRVWDGSGQVRFDLIDRTARLYGVYTIPSIAINGSYTLSVPGFTLGAWFFNTNHPYNIYIIPNNGSITFYHTRYGSTASVSFTAMVFQA